MGEEEAFSPHLLFIMVRLTFLVAPPGYKALVSFPQSPRFLLFSIPSIILLGLSSSIISCGTTRTIQRVPQGTFLEAVPSISTVPLLQEPRVLKE